MLTRMALRARVLTLILMAAVIGLGGYSLARLQIELLPNIDFPVVAISAFYPNTTPEQVSAEVTEPIEQALKGIDGVTSVRSTSSTSLGQVIIESDFGQDMNAVERVVNSRLAGLKLPSNVRPIVSRINPEDFPVLEVSVLGGNDPAALAQMISAKVLPVVQSVPGVSRAEIPVGIGQGLSITRTNGQPSVPISILKNREANTVEVSDAVQKQLEQLKPQLPEGTRFIEIFNQAPGIKSSINELRNEIIVGAILAITVIFVFLLSVRPTLVTSISIPVSILAALTVLKLQGMTLNILTLGALAIAVGRVVDDSIVVMENTFRHVQLGESPREAALKATREVAMPIAASTLTTIAVFAPLALIGGMVSVIFVPFALTITYALLASLVVALTVVPVLASMFISRARPRGESRLVRGYGELLGWALDHRKRVIGGAIALTIASLALVPFIPMNFFSGGPADSLSISMVATGQPTRDQVLGELDQVEAVLARHKTAGVITDYLATYGDAGPFSMGSSNPSRVSLVAKLGEGQDADKAVEQIQGSLAGTGRLVSVTVQGGMGPQSNDLQLTLTGDDPKVLAASANAITRELQAESGVVNVRNDAGSTAPGTPIVRVDGRRAVTISGTITAKNTQKVQQTVSQITNRVGLPPGVRLETGGVFQEMNQTFKKMGIAMLMGVVLVYVVMTITQRSFVTPFIIVLSLPLASIGAMGALFITQRALGLPALIGVLMLIGLVVTNAIVLVAFIEQTRDRGVPLREALLEGGRTRLRPILMTALTTIFVLLPLALGLGTHGSGLIGAELATVVIGGLFSSTFLTLVVVPVVYSLLRRKSPKAAVAPAGEKLGMETP